MGAKNKVIAGDYKGWLVLSSLLGRYAFLTGWTGGIDLTKKFVDCIEGQLSKPIFHRISGSAWGNCIRSGWNVCRAAHGEEKENTRCCCYLQGRQKESARN